MMDTVLDYSIFKDFTASQPEKIPMGTLEENKYWDSFWEFLKQGCNLTITNMMEEINNNEPTNIFLNSLTTGRKGTRFSSESKFKVPHKYKLPHNASPHTVYFLDEKQPEAREKYRQKNGFLFGFKSDYDKVWKSLSLFGKERVLPVRKNARKRFKSWEQLSGYITPFTDLIIVDNYMFDESVWDHNLFKIIKIFADKTPVKFNLTLVSFVPCDKLISYKGVELKIKNKLKELNINCFLTIALATRAMKEHDRVIITNYLEVKSGDSFLYFDKKGEYLTKGTDITFGSLTKPENFAVVSATLRKVKDIITKLQDHREKEKRLFGTGISRLISSLEE